MADLARQAARLIVDSREDWDSENEALCDVQDHIEGVGVLVSHEDAALLREVKRLCDSRGRLTFQDKHGKWYGFAQSSDRVTLAAALKSALDAAGVPDEKGT